MASVAEQLKALGLSPEAAEQAEKQAASDSSEGVYHRTDLHGKVEVVGTVSSVWNKPSKFKDAKTGGVKTDFGVAIEHNGADAEHGPIEAGILKVSNCAYVWEKAVTQENPQVGDVVVFSYGGKVDSKSGGPAYHDYRLTVAKRAVNADGTEKAPF